jgi:hypothetical protein
MQFLQSLQNVVSATMSFERQCGRLVCGMMAHVRHEPDKIAKGERFSKNA